MNQLSIALHRGLGAVLSATRGGHDLPADDPARLLVGDRVRDARVHLVGLAAAASDVGSAAIASTGHTAWELWTAGAPVRYRLDERGELSIEFANGFLLMATARRAGAAAMQVVPLRHSLAALRLLLVPTSGRR